jgi:hypothetical protein
MSLMTDFGFAADVKVEGVEDQSLIDASHEVKALSSHFLATYLLTSLSSFVRIAVWPSMVSKPRSVSSEAIYFLR